MTRHWIAAAMAALAHCWTLSLAAQDKFAQPQIEFFESRIRPVLVEHCYSCHNSFDAREGELALDHRAAVLAGGVGGEIVDVATPQRSRLLAVLRHEIEGLEMPEGGPKLDVATIKDIERWISLGLPDPRQTPPTAAEVAEATSWAATLKRRQQWWSFRPIDSPTPPGLRSTTGAEDSPPHPVDAFIRQKLSEQELQPAAPAAPDVLVRRLHLTLVGLPPTPQAAQAWTRRIQNALDDATRRQVVGELVDELLSSPRYGERWARHWMDWLRYAESHGSEGDPEIAGAWQWRDYLIRALNQDVPLKLLLRELIAGDLMDQPRINVEMGLNESAIGPAHLRMVFHGFAPTDALDEKVRFTDDQVNVLSKAFLGLTVSCARCHDHKFDAISQRDYYAMFGVLAACRPARTIVDMPEKLRLHRRELSELKQEIRRAIADDWLETVSSISAEELLELPWHAELSKQAGAGFERAWRDQLDRFGEQAQRFSDSALRRPIRAWDFTRGEDAAEWYRIGSGLEDGVSPAGDFSVAATGDDALVAIHPAGIFSHGISDKYAARLTSPDVELKQDATLWGLVRGDGAASLRYVVQDYPRNGTVYPVQQLSNKWQWRKLDLAYWTGDRVHVELTTAQDAPLLVKPNPRSWFGVRKVELLSSGQPSPVEFSTGLGLVVEAARKNPPCSPQDLPGVYSSVLTAAIRAWRDGIAADAHALLLDELLSAGVLENRRSELPRTAALLERYRKLEAQIPIPTRVPGVEEAAGRLQPLYVRGDHKQPRGHVPPSFLEAIRPQAYVEDRAARLQLADDLVSFANPLTRRVMVNRVWHHLFGRGLVATPDNFGQLGQMPTHPELLDWLANQLEEKGWSQKQLIRLIVTSRAWQADSRASQAAQRRDPENLWLSHAHLQRLEAEVIRDQLLFLAGRLEHRLGGPPVPSDSSRRSIYVRVVRNALDPFLRVFDFPEPFSAVGRREPTNVPAQSLTLLNDGQIAMYAADWAKRVLADERLHSDSDRVQDMFLAAFGRSATTNELDRALDYLTGTAAESITQPAGPWAELARAMFLFQEFVYVR